MFLEHYKKREKKKWEKKKVSLLYKNQFGKLDHASGELKIFKILLSSYFSPSLETL